MSKPEPASESEPEERQERHANEARKYWIYHGFEIRTEPHPDGIGLSSHDARLRLAVQAAKWLADIANRNDFQHSSSACFEDERVTVHSLLITPTVDVYFTINSGGISDPPESFHLDPAGLDVPAVVHIQVALGMPRGEATYTFDPKKPGTTTFRAGFTTSYGSASEGRRACHATQSIGTQQTTTVQAWETASQPRRYWRDAGAPSIANPRTRITAKKPMTIEDDEILHKAADVLCAWLKTQFARPIHFRLTREVSLDVAELDRGLKVKVHAYYLLPSRRTRPREGPLDLLVSEVGDDVPLHFAAALGDGLPEREMIYHGAGENDWRIGFTTFLAHDRIAVGVTAFLPKGSRQPRFQPSS
ncbi:MAG: hypothetical protein M1837_000562 [Sclerophora amabilis]|nr:MAG: hypothetical protein M1837_000562 [Sclerophora amabilis]